VLVGRTSGTAPVTGEFLVGPGGTINLRQYGHAVARGRQTITEIRVELNQALSRTSIHPMPSVEGAVNSTARCFT